MISYLQEAIDRSTKTIVRVLNELSTGKMTDAEAAVDLAHAAVRKHSIHIEIQFINSIVKIRTSL